MELSMSVAFERHEKFRYGHEADTIKILWLKMFGMLLAMDLTIQRWDPYLKAQNPRS